MKVEVRVHVGQATQLVVQDELSEFRPHPDNAPNIYTLPARSEELEHLCDAAARLQDTIFVHPCVLPTKRDLDSARFLALDAVLTVEIGARDRARTEALPENRGCSPHGFWNRIVLGRHRLRDNGASWVGTRPYGQALVLRESAAAAVADARLSGVKLLDVHDREGAPLGGIQQLLPTHVAPRMERNVTTPVQPEVMTDEARSVLAAPAYEPDVLDALPDISRPADEFAHRFIASQRVRQVVLHHKIRGLRWRPVLEVGSPTYVQVIGDFEHAVRHYLRCAGSSWFVQPDPAQKTDYQRMIFDMASKDEDLLEMLAEAELRKLLGPKTTEE